MNFLAAILLLACTPTALLDFAIPKWQANKAVHIEDAYKWLHQATRGGEHAAPDRESARRWLDKEWEGLEKRSAYGLIWEPLCPDGSIGRVHLRPFRAAAGKPDALLDAFLASAAAYRTEPDAFTEAWSQFGGRLEQGRTWRITHQQWTTLDRRMRAKDYPAIHHSPNYTEAFSPAYRVVLKREADKLKVLYH